MTSVTERTIRPGRPSHTYRTSPMIIREDDLTDHRIVALLGEHLEH
jgi:hypothetical protein